PQRACPHIGIGGDLDEGARLVILGVASAQSQRDRGNDLEIGLAIAGVTGFPLVEDSIGRIDLGSSLARTDQKIQVNTAIKETAVLGPNIPLFGSLVALFEIVEAGHEIEPSVQKIFGREQLQLMALAVAGE